MEDTVTLIQPKYVRNFKCDGQRCGAKCCKGWRIDIDNKSFEKYKKIESAEKEITSHINFNEDRKSYFVQLDEKNNCPFLNEENLCTLQKKYGENFLSSVCREYPRNIVKFGNVFEFSLSLSCPVAAELALTSDDAIRLEITELPHSEISDTPNKIPASVKPHFSVIQLVATFILKQKFFTIDQRLVILGFFWKDIDNLIKENKFKEIEMLAKFYMSPNFLQEKSTEIFSEITFDHQKFLEVMIDGVFKNIFSEDTLPKIKKFFMPVTEGSEKISMEAAKRNFDFWEYKRGKFFIKYDMILSNYLINEIFLNLYPYKVEGSVAHNFATFVAMYKVVEWKLFSKNFRKTELKSVIKAVAEISIYINHDKNYIKKISSAVEDEEDIKRIISTFLHT